MASVGRLSSFRLDLLHIHTPAAAITSILASPTLQSKPHLYFRNWPSPPKGWCAYGVDDAEDASRVSWSSLCYQIAAGTTIAQLSSPASVSNSHSFICRPPVEKILFLPNPRHDRNLLCLARHSLSNTSSHVEPRIFLQLWTFVGTLRLG